MASWGTFAGVGLTVLGIILLVCGIGYNVVLTGQIDEIQTDMDEHEATYGASDNDTHWKKLQNSMDEAKAQQPIPILLIVGGVIAIIAGIVIFVLTIVLGIMASKKMEAAWKGESPQSSGGGWGGGGSSDSGDLGPAQEYDFGGGDKGFDDF